MTQITIRNVDEALAERVREEARRRDESMNDVLLRLLQLHFGKGVTDMGEQARNDLAQFRQGWIEDPGFEATQKAFSQIDEDAWR